MNRIINSLEELEELAKELATSFKSGQVYGLIGDLGAGKTTFVKMVAKALGVKEVVTSPTFVILKNYQIKKSTNPEVNNLVHIDGYRLSKLADLEAVGYLDYAGQEKSVSFIEWADKFPELKDQFEDYQEIEFKIIRELARQVEIG